MSTSEEPQVSIRSRTVKTTDHEINLSGANIVQALRNAGLREVPANASVSIDIPSQWSGDIDIDAETRVQVRWTTTEVEEERKD